MVYQAETLADLRLALQRSYDSVPFWSNAEANDAINESLRRWNLLTGMWKRRELVATVAATSTGFPTGFLYALSSTMVYDVRTEFNQLVMEPTSISDLNNGRTNWRREITTAGGTVPSRPLMWAPVGTKRIAIWPGDAVGGNTLVVDGVRSTPTLTADADFVDLGQCEIGVLLGMALHLLAFKLGGPLFKMTLVHYRHFVEAAADQNARLRSSTWYRKTMGLDRQRMQHPMRLPTGLAEGPPPTSTQEQEQQP